MRKLLFIFLLLSQIASAEVKISQLPLGTAAATTSVDSYPFVNFTSGLTMQMKLWDLVNLPPFQNFTLQTLTANQLFSGNNASSNPSLTLIQNGAAGEIRFKNPSASAFYNWRIGAQENFQNSFEITPSTAANGSTYTQPAFLVTRSRSYLYGADGTNGGSLDFSNVPSSGFYNFLVANNYSANNLWELTPSSTVDGTSFYAPIITANASTGVVSLGQSGGSASHQVNGNVNISGPNLQLNTGGNPASSALIYQHIATGSLALYGDAGTSGGIITLYGASQAGDPSAIRFTTNATLAARIGNDQSFTSYGAANLTGGIVTIGNPNNSTVPLVLNQNNAAGTIEYKNPASSGHYNWTTAAQANINNGFEITPSTAVDGSTFSAPVFSVTNNGATTLGKTSTTPQHSLNTLTAAASNCGTIVGATGCVQMTINGTTHYVPYW